MMDSEKQTGGRGNPNSGDQALSDGSADIAWLNGEWRRWQDCVIHIRTAAHVAVAGAFEGIRAYWCEDDQELYIYRLDDHVARLANSCQLLGLPVSEIMQALPEVAREILVRNEIRGDAYIRPVAFPDATTSDFLKPTSPSTSIFVECWPVSSLHGHLRGLRACTSTWRRVSSSEMIPRAKSFANYAQSRLALNEANAGGADAPILVDSGGFLVEGVGAGIGVVSEGALVLPALSAGALPSVTRLSLKALSSAVLGLRVEERAIDRFECYLADAAFFFGTGWEILEVEILDGRPIGTALGHDLLRQLSLAYYESAIGRTPESQAWVTGVYLP